MPNLVSLAEFVTRWTMHESFYYSYMTCEQFNMIDWITIVLKLCLADRTYEQGKNSANATRLVNNLIK